MQACSSFMEMISDHNFLLIVCHSSWCLREPLGGTNQKWRAVASGEVQRICELLAFQGKKHQFRNCIQFVSTVYFQHLIRTFLYRVCIMGRSVIFVVTYELYLKHESKDALIDPLERTLSYVQNMNRFIINFDSLQAEQPNSLHVKNSSSIKLSFICLQ